MLFTLFMYYKKLLMSCAMCCAVPVKSFFLGMLASTALSDGNFTPPMNSSLITESAIAIPTVRTPVTSTALAIVPTSKIKKQASEGICPLIHTCQMDNSSLYNCTNPESIVIDPSLIGGLWTLDAEEAELAYQLSQFCAKKDYPISFNFEHVNISALIKKQCAGEAKNLVKLYMHMNLLFCANNALIENGRNLGVSSDLITKIMAVSKALSSMPLPPAINAIKDLLPEIKILITLAITFSARSLTPEEWAQGIIAALTILLDVIVLVNEP